MVRITINVMIINSAAAPRWRRRDARGAGRGPGDAEYLDRLLDMVPRSAPGHGPGGEQVFDHPVAVDGLAGFDEMSSLGSIHHPDIAIAIGPCRFVAGGILHRGSIDPHGTPVGAGTQCTIDEAALTRRVAGADW